MKKRLRIHKLATIAALSALLSLSACGDKSNDTSASADALDAVADDNQNSNDKLMKGLRIAGIDVGGMKVSEAQTAIESAINNQIASVTINVAADGQRYPLTASELGVSIDIPALLQQAVALNSDATIVEQAKTSGYDLPISYTIDELTLNNAITQLSTQINSEPVEPTLSFAPDSADIFNVTAGTPGRQLDTAALSTSIQAALASGTTSTDVQAVITTTEPTTNEATLKENVQRIVTFSTVYTGSADRTQNLVLGAEKINGTVLKPGQHFSFNDVVGPRTAEKGWKKAATIVAGSRYEDDYGGGICQVSTTLYNAVLKADLKIENRRHHSLPSNYIEHGLDATVSYGSLDFEFSNNTDYPIYIFSRVDKNESKFYVTIYGRPLPNGERIILRSKQIETLEPGAYETITDETLSPGASRWEIQRRNGFTVQVYKEYMVGDQIVRTENMYKDTYSPVAGVKVVGPGGDTSSSDASAATTDSSTTGGITDFGSDSSSVPDFGDDSSSSDSSSDGLADFGDDSSSSDSSSDDGSEALDLPEA